MTSRPRWMSMLVLLMGVALAAGGCASNQTASSASSTAAVPSAVGSPSIASSLGESPSATAGQPVDFIAEVWVDNWFSLTVNGQAIGEDIEPITQERSFNSQTLEFSATYPLTLAVVSKDYMENASGLEYIGTSKQQIGDGGLIMQVREKASGRVVAVTSQEWRGLVIQEAPLNPDCVTSSQPLVDCRNSTQAEPTGWTSSGFDDSQWPTATVYTADEVGVKGGYEAISWDDSASLIWGPDLKLDNIILWRFTVPGS